MTKFNDFININGQSFLIRDNLYIHKLANYDLYYVSMWDEPLFFISPYLASVIVSRNLAYSDGLIRDHLALEQFLKTRKVLYKNCYFDLVYKNKKEIQKDCLDYILEK